MLAAPDKLTNPLLLRSSAGCVGQAAPHRFGRACARITSYFWRSIIPLEAPAKARPGPVLMAEDPVFCTVSADGSGFRHHKQKIVLFLAAMRSYRDQLEAAGYRVIYSELEESMAKPMPFVERVRAAAKQESVDGISWFEISDRSAASSMEALVDDPAGGLGAAIAGFPDAADLAKDWLSGRKQLKLDDFYSWQRNDWVF